MSLESKTNKKETHTGTFLVMREHVTKRISIESKWHTGLTADVNRLKDRRKGHVWEMRLLNLNKMATSG